LKSLYPSALLQGRFSPFEKGGQGGILLGCFHSVTAFSSIRISTRPAKEILAGKPGHTPLRGRLAASIRLFPTFRIPCRYKPIFRSSQFPGKIPAVLLNQLLCISTARSPYLITTQLIYKINGYGAKLAYAFRPTSAGGTIIFLNMNYRPRRRPIEIQHTGQVTPAGAVDLPGVIWPKNRHNPPVSSEINHE
jgi:hypothetical protein